MNGCCDELGCKRRKPIKLMRSGLTGTWYVVTAYTEGPRGAYRATTKHALEPEMQDQLNELVEGAGATDA